MIGIETDPGQAITHKMFETKGWGKRVLHCRMLHATKSDIDVRLCSVHLPSMWHAACKKVIKNCVFF